MIAWWRCQRIKFKKKISIMLVEFRKFSSPSLNNSLFIQFQDYHVNLTNTDLISVSQLFYLDHPRKVEIKCQFYLYKNNTQQWLWFFLLIIRPYSLVNHHNSKRKVRDGREGARSLTGLSQTLLLPYTSLQPCQTLTFPQKFPPFSETFLPSILQIQFVFLNDRVVRMEASFKWNW